MGFLVVAVATVALLELAAMLLMRSGIVGHKPGFSDAELSKLYPGERQDSAGMNRALATSVAGFVAKSRRLPKDGPSISGAMR